MPSEVRKTIFLPGCSCAHRLPLLTADADRPRVRIRVRTWSYLAMTTSRLSFRASGGGASRGGWILGIIPSKLLLGMPHRRHKFSDRLIRSDCGLHAKPTVLAHVKSSHEPVRSSRFRRLRKSTNCRVGLFRYITPGCWPSAAKRCSRSDWSARFTNNPSQTVHL